MGDRADEQEKKENVLKVEEAKSGRSTCKSTGDKIEKGAVDASHHQPSKPWTGAKANTNWHCMQESGGLAWTYMLVGVSPQGGRWVKLGKA